MIEIFIGSLILSIIHTLIPNHWIPLVILSRTEQWALRQSVLATIITGFAHTLSTVLVGILVGLAGYKLSQNYGLISSTIAPAILIGLGITYIFFDINGNIHHQHKSAKEIANVDSSKNKKSRWFAILTSLSIAMFLTPCVEIEAYYFRAGIIGWQGIFIVSAVYTITTVMLMTILVYLGIKGINSFKSHFLEHHEKGVTGLILMILGVLAFFVKF